MDSAAAVARASDSCGAARSGAGRAASRGKYFGGAQEARALQVVYLPREDGESVSIGRGSKADVSLGREYKQVSRVHLIATRVAARRFVVRVPGTNGAVIDRVSYPCNSRATGVRDGAVCVLGDARFVFRDPALEDATTGAAGDHEIAGSELLDSSMTENCPPKMRGVDWGNASFFGSAADPFTCGPPNASILPPKKRASAGSHWGQSSGDVLPRSDPVAVPLSPCSPKSAGDPPFSVRSSSPVRYCAPPATAAGSTPNTERFSSLTDVTDIQTKTIASMSPSKQHNTLKESLKFTTSGSDNKVGEWKPSTHPAEVPAAGQRGFAVRKPRDPAAEGSRLRKEIEDVKAAAQAVKFFTSKAARKPPAETTFPVTRSSARSSEEQDSKENSGDGPCPPVSAAPTDRNRRPSLLRYARECKPQQDAANHAKRRCPRLSSGGASSPLSSVPDVLTSSGDESSGDDAESARGWNDEAGRERKAPESEGDSSSRRKPAANENASTKHFLADADPEHRDNSAATPQPPPPHPPGGPYSYESLIADALVFSGKRSMTISDVLEEMAGAVPSARRPEEAPFWRHHVSRALEEHPFFVRVPRTGKDATGKEREDLWHYDISADPDAARRATYADIGKGAPRSCTMVDTQYYWKPVPKLQSWKGRSSCSRGGEGGGKKKKIAAKSDDINTEESCAAASAE